VAQGRAIGKFEAGLGVIGLVALFVAYCIITGYNPLPRVGAWLDRARTLSDPAPTWSIRVGDQPNAAVGARGAVLILARGTVEARDPATGGKMWSHEAGWASAAGSDSSGGVVVVLAAAKGHGYDVVDAASGSPLWTDRTATGVWTFANMVLGIECTDTFSCTLTSRTPRDGSVRWEASLSGNNRPFDGVNRPLPGLRPVSKSIVDARGALPVPAPPLLGFPVDNQLQVVSTSDGKRVRTYKSTQTTRLVVAGNRVLISSAVPRDGGCRFSVEARDPYGDRQVWHRDGLDLGTSADIGCTQRSDPNGGGGLLHAVTLDDRDALFDVAGGGEAYLAEPGEKVLSTDGRIALVRTADRKTVKAVDVLGGGRTLWSRPAARGAGLALTPSVVVIADAGTGRLTAVTPDGGQVLVDVTSGAGVLGYAGNGLVVNIGRQIGLLAYRGAG
jgi:hypothetical protein